MATPKTINDLSAAAAMATTDTFPIWRNSQTLKATADLLPFLQSGIGATAETLQTAVRKIFFSDSYTTLQNAADAAAGGILVIRGTNTITAAVTLSSNTDIFAAPGALVQSATTSISLFKATSKTNIKIRGVHFKYTAAGSSGLIGGVELQSCTNCVVEDNDFEGMQWAGPFLQNSERCTVRGNDIYSTLGTHVDASDIIIYDNSKYDLIEGNWCFGTGGHGILCQGTTGTLPFRNQFKSNYVNQKTTYGIVNYLTTAGDTETLIDGNHVWDILGSGLAGASGSGIYVQTAGGNTVTNNWITNCCGSTTSTSNLPAGISMALNGAIRETNIVSHNHIISQPKYSGIAISDSSNETICDGNEITFSDGAAGIGIQLVDSSNTSVINNRIKAAITVARPAISVLANGADCVNNKIAFNDIVGTNGNLISFSFASTNRHKKANVIGNTCVSTGASAQALVASGLTGSTISNNTLEAPAAGFYVDTVVNCRGSGNVVTVGTTNAFLSGGTCSNTFFDDSNDFGTNTGLIQNTAAGVNIRVRLGAVPASGNWQVGDEWTQTTPTAAGVPGGMCVTAGAPGTWKNRAALAA
jgi:parallel beta-helix repeat protein